MVAPAWRCQTRVLPAGWRPSRRVNPSTEIALAAISAPGAESTFHVAAGLRLRKLAAGVQDRRPPAALLMNDCRQCDVTHRHGMTYDGGDYAAEGGAPGARDCEPGRLRRGWGVGHHHRAERGRERGYYQQRSLGGEQLLRAGERERGAGRHRDLDLGRGRHPAPDRVYG